MLLDRKSTRLNSSHTLISYAVFCLKKKKKIQNKYETLTHNQSIFFIICYVSCVYIPPHTTLIAYIVFASSSFLFFFFFFFNDTATTEIYTLSLHDALPISVHLQRPRPRVVRDARPRRGRRDRKSTRLNSSHTLISYAVFCLKKKKKNTETHSPRAHTAQGTPPSST